MSGRALFKPLLGVTYHAPMEFGERTPGVEYQERPGAYGIAFDDEGRVLCVAAPVAFYLPGGGVGEGESHEDALLREVAEETGYRAVVGERLGEATQVVPAFLKHGVFFRMDVGDRDAEGAFDHQHVWLPIDQALSGLSEESHVWALKRALEAR